MSTISLLLRWVVSTSEKDLVSFQPILCHPHTQIRIILSHDEQRDIPNLEFSHSHVSIGLSQIAFPIIVLLKDDHTDFVQEERLGLPYWTMILAICVVVDGSKCLDNPILEFSIICEHLPFLLGYKLILRLLLVHRNQAIWRWYSWSYLLSFEMLKILVQWILHKNQNCLLQYYRGAQLDLCIFGALPPIQHLSDDISIIALSTWPQPFASQSEREVGASPRLPVRPGPQPLHHLTRWAGGKIKAIKRATFSAKWPRTSMSTGPARCARNKRATCIVPQWSHIRRYVVQVSCLGLYFAKFHSTSRRLSEHCLEMLFFSLKRTCTSMRQRTCSACSSKSSIDHNRVSPVKHMAVNSLWLRDFWSAVADKVASCCASSSSRKSVIRLEYTNPLAHLLRDQKHHCNEFSCLRVHHLHGLHTSPKSAEEENQWDYERPFVIFMKVQFLRLHSQCLYIIITKWLDDKQFFSVLSLSHHDLWPPWDSISEWPDETRRQWRTCHRRGMFWLHPLILRASFLFALNLHLAQHPSRTPCHGVLKKKKKTCTGSKSSSVHIWFRFLILCSPSVNRPNTSTP